MDPHWDDMRVFLFVAREESLSGAGKRLNMDPATVGRRIARLEAAMSTTLFAKSPQGYTLTGAGERLLRHGEEAELAMRAGVDALTLGATKNGCIAAEAIIVFDPARASEIERRRMRAGHLLSKHRFLAAQILAWLEDGLWLDLAARANTAARRLSDGLTQRNDVRFCFEPEANMLFVDMPRAVHRRLLARGAAYHLWSGGLEGDADDEMLTARLVCDWSKTEAEIDTFLALF